MHPTAGRSNSTFGIGRKSVNLGVVSRSFLIFILLFIKTPAFSVVYSSAEQTRSFRSALLNRMRGGKKKEKLLKNKDFCRILIKYEKQFDDFC